MRYAIILAGGIGSRFWPLSREDQPKQFLRILGSDTFFEATLERVRAILPGENIFIVTNHKYFKKIKNQSSGYNIPAGNIILEPKPLNTLPALAVCARIIYTRDPRANLLVLPSDQYIREKVKFRKVITKAFATAEKGFLCLIGVKPDSPCCGYGYINTGKFLFGDIRCVKSFKEKPAPSEARRIYRKKDMFWNAGIFCFKAGVVLNEIERYLPDFYSLISKIKEKKDIYKVWHKISPLSIDYGLIEKTKNLAMITADFYWRDLGSWDAAYNELPKDKEKNVLPANCVSMESSNNLIISNNTNRVIAVAGVNDLIIVDTPDALLVCRKDKAQDVKKIVEALKKKRKKCV